MISKAFQLGRRHTAVRLAVCAALVLSLLAPLATPAYAAGGQYGSVQGTVVDASTKAPIAGATVAMAAPTGNYTTTTNGSGFFNFLGVVVDTYTLSIQAKGYDSLQQSGITVTGDQTIGLGNISLSKTLHTIAHTTSRPLNGAFQPTQTIDQYTVSGNRIIETTGKAATTNENALLLAVPGVTLTNAGSPTIRGGSAHEVGYQFDGVTFTEPFLASNGNGESTGSGLFNGIGNVQVVEGAGDATQGNVGSGVINLIPKRGASPSFGYLDVEAGGPSYFHQLAFEYGFATHDDSFSDYISYNGQRYDPYHGYVNSNPALFGNYYGRSYQRNDQFLNNAVFKFGHNHNQSLQVLYMNTSAVGYGDYGGVPGQYSPTNPNGFAYYPYDVPYNMGSVFEPSGPNFGAEPGASQGLLAFLSGYDANQFSNLIALNAYTPGVNIPVQGPQEVDSLQTRYLKFEYDNNLSANTYLALKYYNWEQLEYNDTSYSNGASAGYATGNGTLGGIATPVWQQVGGPTVGGQLDITQQLGSKLTVTLDGKYDIVEPVWNSYQSGLAVFGIGALNFGDLASSQGPSSLDWLPTNPITGAPGYIYNYFCGSTPWAAGAPKPSCLPRLPNWGIDYEGNKWQNYGAGIRFQYAPVNPVRLDLGVRYEGQNEHWTDELDNFGQGVPTATVNNPFAVPSSYFTNAFLHPTEFEPRAGLTWEVDPRTSVRFGYGRSAVFSVGQNGGTPFWAAGLAPYMSVPIPDCATNAGSAAPATACVTGGTATTPFSFVCGITGKPGYATFPCKSYGAALYWAEDSVETPDAGNTHPAIYSNYDLSFSHQFSNGWGARLTPFYKLGTTLPTFNLIAVLPGGGAIFGTSNLGLNRTTGVEFNLTTPDRPVGVSGFFSATYQNVLSTTPPLSVNETNVPLVSPATLALGDTYRAGYVSPFSMRLGGTYNTRSGFSATPVIQFNIGYPYSLGTLNAAQLANGTFANVPRVNFGPSIGTFAQLSGLQNQGGAQLAPYYYDPADPGTVSNPNIFVTRGTPATSASGGYLSHYNMTGNLTLQYKRGGNTFGIQMANLFGNAYVNSVPTINPFYQPVATGLSGPLTNVNTCQQVFGSARGCANFSKETYAFQNGAYLLSNGDFTGTPSLAPLNPFTFQLYYQRAL
jgi:hypothetical protein